MRVSVVGASGFIGRAVVERVRSSGHEAITVAGVRFPAPVSVGPRGQFPTKQELLHAFTEDPNWEATRRRVARELQGSDTVVNAAGLAQPRSEDVRALLRANTALPALVAAAAIAAGVGRMIHVSSAAVQGRRDPLDESPEHQPFSPYSKSKALAERLLFDIEQRAGIQIGIYRATSVQGEDRDITRSLIRLAQARWIPLVGNGDAPLPVALITTTAAAIAHLATCTGPVPLISLHPWEGMTQRRLFEAFAEQPSFVRLPRRATNVLLSTFRSLAQHSANMAGITRRLELLGQGQRQDAAALASVGFHLMAQFEDYAEMAQRVRASMAS